MTRCIVLVHEHVALVVQFTNLKIVVLPYWRSVVCSSTRKSARKHTQTYNARVRRRVLRSFCNFALYHNASFHSFVKTTCENSVWRNNIKNTGSQRVMSVGEVIIWKVVLTIFKRLTHFLSQGLTAYAVDIFQGQEDNKKFPLGTNCEWSRNVLAKYCRFSPCLVTVISCKDCSMIDYVLP